MQSVTISIDIKEGNDMLIEIKSGVFLDKLLVKL